ncbi:MAG: SPFH domain-containing protein [Actinomycetota bacterium]
MATITNRPIYSHLRTSANSWVRLVARGDVARSGAGQAFWFRPRVSSVSELPLDERELPLVFRDRTSDYQEIAVQASITYRFVAPEVAVERIDFTIDNRSGSWTATPLEQVGGLLTELAQQHAAGVLAAMPLTEVMVNGITRLRAAVGEGLRTDDRIDQTGIEIVDVRVVAVRPAPDMEKALQTPVREELQQEADRATFERRALAVEQERGISENELQNRIELAKREEELVTQEGANQQKRVADAAEASRIQAVAESENIEVRGRAEAATIRELGAAEAETERNRVAAYAGVGDSVLVALAAKDFAGNLPDVGTLVVAPDLLAPLMTKLLGAGADGPGVESTGGLVPSMTAAAPTASSTGEPG